MSRALNFRAGGLSLKKLPSESLQYDKPFSACSAKKPVISTQNGTVTCQSAGGGISGYEIAQASSAFDTSALKAAIATCPVCKKVVGGGAAYSNVADGVGAGSSHEVAIIASYPKNDRNYLAQADWMGGGGQS